MLYVDSQRCTGCGLCVETCPTGAIRLIGGVAHIETDLCQECAACVSSCPEQAILEVTKPAEKPLPIARPEPEVIQVKLPPAPAPAASPRTGILPVVGAALAWAGREVVPRLATYLLEVMDRRRARPRIQPPAQPGAVIGVGRGGRRRRRRWRGR